MDESSKDEYIYQDEIIVDIENLMEILKKAFFNGRLINEEYIYYFPQYYNSMIATKENF